MNRKTLEFFEGCLLGGAVGDALGAPVEFMTLAVNHGGDSDSTGAITGNLLGALLGRAAIPGKYMTRLELVPLIEEIAVDLHALVFNQ